LKQEELAVDTKNTSRDRNKHQSASDPRASATGVGLVGVSLVVIVLGFAVIMDTATLIAYIVKAIRNCQSRSLEVKMSRSHKIIVQEGSPLEVENLDDVETDMGHNSDKNNDGGGGDGDDDENGGEEHTGGSVEKKGHFTSFLSETEKASMACRWLKRKNRTQKGGQSCDDEEGGEGDDDDGHESSFANGNTATIGHHFSFLKVTEKASMAGHWVKMNARTRKDRDSCNDGDKEVENDDMKSGSNNNGLNGQSSGFSFCSETSKATAARRWVKRNSCALKNKESYGGNGSSNNAGKIGRPAFSFRSETGKASMAGRWLKKNTRTTQEHMRGRDNDERSGGGDDDAHQSSNNPPKSGQGQPMSFRTETEKASMASRWLKKNGRTGKDGKTSGRNDAKSGEDSDGKSESKNGGKSGHPSLSLRVESEKASTASRWLKRNGRTGKDGKTGDRNDAKSGDGKSKSKNEGKTGHPSLSLHFESEKASLANRWLKRNKRTLLQVQEKKISDDHAEKENGDDDKNSNGGDNMGSKGHSASLFHSESKKASTASRWLKRNARTLRKKSGSNDDEKNHAEGDDEKSISSNNQAGTRGHSLSSIHLESKKASTASRWMKRNAHPLKENDSSGGDGGKTGADDIRNGKSNGKTINIKKSGNPFPSFRSAPKKASVASRWLQRNTHKDQGKESGGDDDDVDDDGKNDQGDDEESRGKTVTVRKSGNPLSSFRSAPKKASVASRWLQRNTHKDQGTEVDDDDDDDVDDDGKNDQGDDGESRGETVTVRKSGHPLSSFRSAPKKASVASRWLQRNTHKDQGKVEGDDDDVADDDDAKTDTDDDEMKGHLSVYSRSECKRASLACHALKKKHGLLTPRTLQAARSNLRPVNSLGSDCSEPDSLACVEVACFENAIAMDTCRSPAPPACASRRKHLMHVRPDTILLHVKQGQGRDG
jgi:hypothetical protein